VALLKRLGADRVVDYKVESLKAVLRKEYPKGIDLVYESVGGDMFRTAVGALADKGRLVIIGMMSQVNFRHVLSCACWNATLAAIAASRCVSVH
jgi:NADPH-dependent curcumin reductase CurA